MGKRRASMAVAVVTLVASTSVAACSSSTSGGGSSGLFDGVKGADSGAPGSFCAAAAADKACVMCMKVSCCSALTECAENAGCATIAACASKCDTQECALGCYAATPAGQSTAGNLLACGRQHCAAACGAS